MNYLAHHGIKGQKWGVRRFQNPDGTLTDIGKKRYGSDSIDVKQLKKSLFKEKRTDKDVKNYVATSNSEIKKIASMLNSYYKDLDNEADELQKDFDKECVKSISSLDKNKVIKSAISESTYGGKNEKLLDFEDFESSIIKQIKSNFSTNKLSEFSERNKSINEAKVDRDYLIKQFTTDILGKHANDPISMYNGSFLGGYSHSKLSNVVERSLNSMVKEGKLSYYYRFNESSYSKVANDFVNDMAKEIKKKGYIFES